MITADNNGRLNLSDGSDPRAAYAGLNALSPVLMGLTLPLVGFMILAPMAFQRSGPILLVLLMLLFFVALVVFVVSVFFKGPIVALAAEPGSGMLEIYRAGPFATSQERIDTDDVADLKVSTVYDDDGYATRLPHLVLEDGATVEIPMMLDDSDVRLFRKVLGLAV